ncbi:MAG: PP2C family protein-serine/threonine phosphatase [Gemmatimonadaceae bacterium]
MKLASPFSTAATKAPADDRPRDAELDLFGLTHPGRVRTENQDQYVLCTVHPQVVVHGTSLPDPESFAGRSERLATIMLVADGVGGSVAGSRASRLAAEAVTRYVSSALRSYNAGGASSEREFMKALREAALGAHDTVRAEAAAEPAERGMATTLCLAVVVWPWMYVVQVGDSRCYFFLQGKLWQITRDQTMAQALVDQGVLSRDDARASPLSQVLASAIGAEELTPEITRVSVRERGCVILVCTDGLTKHVSDPEIATALAGMRSAEQVCRDLLELALDRGGSDNVTLVVGRALKKSNDPPAVPV